MEQMEKVDILREKTGCGFAEAKAALEASGGELLEALCWLESHGKVQLTGASCSTEDRQPPQSEPKEEKPSEPGPFVRGCRAVWQGLMDLLRWGNRNELVMWDKDGKREMGMPVTLLVILLLVAFWIVLAFVVIAIFCGCRFSMENAADQPSDSEEAPQQQKP